MPSLSDKLKSLGVKVGAADLPKVESLREFEVDKVVPGSFRSTSAGDTYVASQTFGPDYRHGQTSILPQMPLSVLAAWANEPRFADLPLDAYAFLDAETSGLAGGTGTYAFLVGAGRFVNSEFLLEQFFMRDPAEEPALLEGLAEFLAPAQALVTFNGKAFDAPLLTTRYALHHFPLPFKDYAHLDLLPLSRRLWRDRLPSRALKYLEENILAAPRTVDEVPGYEIPYLYFDYLRSGDARALSGVFYHNAMDVVAMAALLSHVNHILADPFTESVEHGLDVVALAKLHEDLGEWETATRLFEKGLEMNLPETDFWLALQRLSHLQKRRGDLQTAVRLWQQAAADGHVYAFIELAKYYEHNLRDYPEAVKWTKNALDLVGTLDIPRYIYNHWTEDLNHRLERLNQKSLKKAAGNQ